MSRKRNKGLQNISPAEQGEGKESSSSTVLKTNDSRAIWILPVCALCVLEKQNVFS